MANAIAGAACDCGGGLPPLWARAIVAAVASGHPPHHLLLGNDAFEGAMAKVAELREAWRELEDGTFIKGKSTAGSGLKA